QDAFAARSAGGSRGSERPARRVGSPPGGARTIQERGAIALSEAAARGARLVEAGPLALRRRRRAGRAGGVAGGSGARFSAGAGEAQRSRQDRIAPRYIYRGADD